jgi:hypothetical protein
MTENSMKTEAHHIKLPKRTGVCAVTEYPDRIVIAMRFSRIGCFGDLAEIKQWCMSIFKRYDSDPRPVVMCHPLSNEMAVITGDANSFVAVIMPSPR